MRTCFINCKPGDIIIMKRSGSTYLCLTGFINAWHRTHRNVSIMPGYVEVVSVGSGDKYPLLLGIDSLCIDRIIKKK